MRDSKKRRKRIVKKLMSLNFPKYRYDVKKETGKIQKKLIPFDRLCGYNDKGEIIINDASKTEHVFQPFLLRNDLEESYEKFKVSGKGKQLKVFLRKEEIEIGVNNVLLCKQKKRGKYAWPALRFGGKFKPPSVGEFISLQGLYFNVNGMEDITCFGSMQSKSEKKSFKTLEYEVRKRNTPILKKDKRAKVIIVDTFSNCGYRIELSGKNGVFCVDTLDGTFVFICPPDWNSCFSLNLSPGVTQKKRKREKADDHKQSFKEWTPPKRRKTENTESNLPSVSQCEQSASEEMEYANSLSSEIGPPSHLSGNDSPTEDFFGFNDSLTYQPLENLDVEYPFPNPDFFESPYLNQNSDDVEFRETTYDKGGKSKLVANVFEKLVEAKKAHHQNIVVLLARRLFCSVPVLSCEFSTSGSLELSSQYGGFERYSTMNIPMFPVNFAFKKNTHIIVTGHGKKFGEKNNVKSFSVHAEGKMRILLFNGDTEEKVIFNEETIQGLNVYIFFLSRESPFLEIEVIGDFKKSRSPPPNLLRKFLKSVIVCCDLKVRVGKKKGEIVSLLSNGLDVQSEGCLSATEPGFKFLKIEQFIDAGADRRLGIERQLATRVSFDIAERNCYSGFFLVDKRGEKRHLLSISNFSTRSFNVVLYEKEAIIVEEGNQKELFSYSFNSEYNCYIVSCHSGQKFTIQPIVDYGTLNKESGVREFSLRFCDDNNCKDNDKCISGFQFTKKATINNPEEDLCASCFFAMDEKDRIGYAIKVVPTFGDLEKRRDITNIEEARSVMDQFLKCYLSK